MNDLDPLQARQEKIKRLGELKINLYPSDNFDNIPLAKIRVYCDRHCAELECTGAKEFLAAGRIKAHRGQGAIAFIDLEDESDKLQIVIRQDKLKEGATLLPNLDLGDIIGVKGRTYRTKRGESSLLATEITLLAKSQRPLPDKWHGLKDQEKRLRQRYVDLIMNPQVRDLFRQRSQFINNWRTILREAGYTEAETPVLEHVPGGADAEPFITRHNTLDIELFLRISLELHLKRLLVGGFEKVFELGRVFRNEGMSTQHLQEFTMLEFYEAYTDYNQLMKFIENTYAEVIKRTFGSTVVKHGKQTLDFTPPWNRTKYVDVIEKETGINVADASEEVLRAAVKEHCGNTSNSDKSLNRARLIDLLYKKTVRPRLKEVQFLIDPPIAVSPLAKKHRNNPQLAERFWVLAATAEIGNGFSELNDPIDQRQRFAAQEEMRERGDNEAHRLDEDYIRALEYGMPPAAGFGVGIDRLFSILTDQPSIRDVVLFPTMRKEESS